MGGCSCLQGLLVLNGVTGGRHGQPKARTKLHMLMGESHLAAALLHHTIEGHALNCTTVYPLIPKLEPAARKAGVGIGKVLQEVFAEVRASSHGLA